MPLWSAAQTCRPLVLVSHSDLIAKHLHCLWSPLEVLAACYLCKFCWCACFALLTASCANRDALLSSSNSFGHASRIDAAFKKKRSPVKDTYGLSVTAPLPDARYVQDTRFSPPAPRFAPHQLPLSRADSYYAGNRRDAQVIAEANRYDTGYLPAHARTMPAQQQQQQHHQPYAPATATSNQYRFGGRYDPMQGMGLGNPMPSSYSAYQSTMPPPPQHHPHHHATAAMATAGPYQGKEKSGGKRIAPPLDGYIYQVGLNCLFACMLHIANLCLPVGPIQARTSQLCFGSHSTAQHSAR